MSRITEEDAKILENMFKKKQQPIAEGLPPLPPLQNSDFNDYFKKVEKILGNPMIQNKVRDFIHSIQNYMIRYRIISDKQKASVDKIYAGLCNRTGFHRQVYTADSGRLEH